MSWFEWCWMKIIFWELIYLITIVIWYILCVQKRAILEPNNHADLAIETMTQMLQNVSFYIFRRCLPKKTHLLPLKKVEFKYWELVWSLRIIIPKYLYLQSSENAAHYKNIRIFYSMMAPFGLIYSCIPIKC